MIFFIIIAKKTKKIMLKGIIFEPQHLHTVCKSGDIEIIRDISSLTSMASMTTLINQWVIS